MKLALMPSRWTKMRSCVPANIALLRSVRRAAPCAPPQNAGPLWKRAVMSLTSWNCSGGMEMPNLLSFKSHLIEKMGRRILVLAVVIAMPMLSACGGRAVAIGDAAVSLDQGVFTHRDTGSSVSPDSKPASGGPAVLKQCGQSGSVKPYTDMADFTSLLTGRWLYCSGYRLSKNAEFGGIELAKDFRFFLLRLTSQGKIERMVGAKNQGKWIVHKDTTSQWNQVDLVYQAGYSNLWHVSFDDKPRKIQVSQTAGSSEYIQSN
jgi:hypothetical protein